MKKIFAPKKRMGSNEALKHDDALFLKKQLPSLQSLKGTGTFSEDYLKNELLSW